MRLTSLAIGLVIATLSLVAFGVTLTPLSPAPQGAKEGVAFDSATGNYVITYEAEDELRPKGLYQTIYTPATKIEPTVESRFEQTSSGNRVTYKFKVKNGKKSQQNLEMLILLVSNTESNLVTPAGWGGSAVENLGGTEFRVGWSYDGPEDLGGLTPGQTLNGFGLASNDLPGVGIIQLSGATPIQAYAGDGPSEKIEAEVRKLNDANFVPLPAAVPRITLPNPFNAAVVLGSIQQHVKTDMVSMHLIDPALLTLIDRSLTQAIAAAQSGNTQSLLHEIKNLRKLLKQEHADVDKDNDGDRDDDDKEKRTKSRIDKLAARVLDFDLKYVEMRVKGEKD